MRCTVVKTSESIKKMDHEKLGELCGLNFIKVRHKNEFAAFSYSMRGFQGAEIFFSNVGNKKSYTYQLTKNLRQEDCALPKSVVFEPEEETNELLAIIPDTDFNRQRLAMLVHTDLEPKVLDAAIAKDVMERSKVYRREVEKTLSKDEVITNQNDELLRLKEENERLKRDAAEKEKSDNVVLQAAREQGQKNVEEYKKRVRAEVKELVYEEMADVITDLKERLGPDWAKGAEYKNSILKEVEMRTAKRLAEEGVETNVDSGSDS